MTIDNSRSHACTPSAMSGLLDVEVVRDDLSATVIFVRGELDREAVPLLAGCLREVLDVGGSGRTVVLNLAETGFVDLGGMRLLTNAAGWAAARDVRLYVAGCSASLLRLLHVSGLLDGLAVVPFVQADLIRKSPVRGHGEPGGRVSGQDRRDLGLP